MQPLNVFTVREMAEIRLAKYYALFCDHGTAGHNRLSLIAKMADALSIDYDFDARKWTIPEDILVIDGNGNPAELV